MHFPNFTFSLINLPCTPCKLKGILRKCVTFFNIKSVVNSTFHVVRLFTPKLVDLSIHIDNAKLRHLCSLT